MNLFFRKIIVDRVRKKYKKTTHTEHDSFKQQVKDLEVEISHEIHDILYLFIGVLAASFGLKGFLLPSSFIDGGVTGISLIVSELTSWPLSILIFILNLPFVILAYIAINKRFAINSIIGILLLALAVHFIPFPTITNDKILIAAFGGFFLGLGIGMAIRGGAIIDGTEVLAIYISRKSSLTVGNVILLFNIVIFMTAAYIFTTEIALYAILTYFSASKTVDFVIDGIEEFIGVTIISERHDAIRKAIIHKMGRGCTIYKGKRGFSADNSQLKDIDVVYTVITRLEMSTLKTEIDKIDKNAFIIMNSVKDTKGGMIKKKPLTKIKS
ncbi:MULTISPECIES: YitT family protein [Galbibacter]|uniref:YitT family protein n=1 Tax=Galbibacter pacificus TaxID=2996052 RepID=A0ABT6FPY4_9FLAO|nr:YitT family protein [Galbibacter pacificus]MDG3582207.1 YitT family protein [Galbibacter pacificus]MDG3585317.1 YitT family protein [Galbibacter pacificus]